MTLEIFGIFGRRAANENGGPKAAASKIVQANLGLRLAAAAKPA